MNSLTISYVIKSDHRVVNQLYQNYLMYQGNFGIQQLYSNQILRELIKHTIAEETIVYPAFEQYLGAEGKIIADKDRVEHQTAKALMCLLAATPVTDPQHSYLLGTIMSNVNEHIIGEEYNDLPKFESAITPYYSALLAQLFQQTKLYIAV